MTKTAQPERILTAAEYAQRFGVGGTGTAAAPLGGGPASGLASSPSDKLLAALEHARDNRKFEIDLYWKRATYFWTLIAATFAGYFAILAADKPPSSDEKPLLAFALGCIGIVFTFAWFLVNRGSKQWQENWENHVDMLEDEVTGPLYKTVMRRPPDADKDFISKHVTGPAEISVSKINQLVNVFTMAIWLLLCAHVSNVYGPNSTRDVSWERVAVAALALIACYLLNRLGRTHTGPHQHVAHLRSTIVLDVPTLREHEDLLRAKAGS